VALIARDVAAGQADGSVRAGDPRTIAQALLLLTQSLVLSAGIADDVPEPALIDEFARIVDASLQTD
jgi:hypothetical protein